MDASNDLIISVLKGQKYGWSDASTFSSSIKRFGFTGRKVLFVSDITADLREHLLADGFELVDFTCNDSEYPFLNGLPFWTIRHQPVIDFLEHHDEFRYVVCVDLVDLVFQSDPFIWLEKYLSPHKLIGCTEGMRIEEEYYNNGWLKQAAPDTATYEMARKHEICCCGTLAGDAHAMLDLLRGVYIALVTSPNKPDYMGGVTPLIDQGVLNYILRISPFKEIVRVPALSEGFTASVNWYAVHRWVDRPIPEFRDGMFYPQGKLNPFCIVHQYNRDATWKSAVEERYAN